MAIIEHMLTTANLRGLMAMSLLLTLSVLNGCPRQQPADDGAASSAAGAATADSAPATGGEDAAAQSPATNPVEQQEHADAAPDKVPQAGPDTTESEQKEPRKAMTAEEVFKVGNCAMCHGQDLNGTPLGPPLKGVKANWDVPKLLAYFKDPATYADNDPRLAANKGKYSVPMPPQRLPDAELTTLAEWLLEQ